jgi:hypothetical protein
MAIAARRERIDVMASLRMSVDRNWMWTERDENQELRQERTKVTMDAPKLAAVEVRSSDRTDAAAMLPKS